MTALLKRVSSPDEASQPVQQGATPNGFSGLIGLGTDLHGWPLRSIALKVLWSYVSASVNRTRSRGRSLLRLLTHRTSAPILMSSKSCPVIGSLYTTCKYRLGRCVSSSRLSG